MEAVKRVQDYLGKTPKWVIYALAAYGLFHTVKAALCPLAAVQTERPRQSPAALRQGLACVGDWRF